MSMTHKATPFGWICPGSPGKYTKTLSLISQKMQKSNFKGLQPYFGRFATDFISKTKTALLELDKSGRGKWVVEQNIFQSHSNHWIFLP